MAKNLLQLLADNRKIAGRTVKIVQKAREATLYLYDAIVSSELEAEWYGGVTAQGLVPQIDQIDADVIHVRINSPGGDVFAAKAIAAALERHTAKAVAHIDGLAASAATAIACACDEVHMAPGAMYMIHNTWTIGIGDKNDFLDTAALLEKCDGALAATYAECSGKPVAEIAKLMDAETWFTADEAVAAGFADAIEGDSDEKAEARATWNLSAFAHAPNAKEPPAEPPKKTEPQDTAPTEAELAARERTGLMNRRPRAVA